MLYPIRYGASRVEHPVSPLHCGCATHSVAREAVKDEERDTWSCR